MPAAGQGSQGADGSHGAAAQADARHELGCRRSTRCSVRRRRRAVQLQDLLEQAGMQDHRRAVRPGLRMRVAAGVRPRAVLLQLVAHRDRESAVLVPFLAIAAVRYKRDGADCASSRSSSPRRSTCSRARCAPGTRSPPAWRWWPTRCRSRSAPSSRCSTTSRTTACRCLTRCGDFARRIPVLDARFFVTAVLIQRESGGNLVRGARQPGQRHPRSVSQ